MIGDSNWLPVVHYLMMAAMADVTQILQEIENGDGAAADRLLPLVYEELRQLARKRLAQEKPGQTLQGTALVHEAYLRLVGRDDKQDWRSRAHFFAAAAEAMRRILIENFRRKRAARHGEGSKLLPLMDIDLAWSDRHQELLEIDDILDHFGGQYPRQAQVFKLRCFAGLTIGEIANALQISSRTVNVDLAFARAWLSRNVRE